MLFQIHCPLLAGRKEFLSTKWSINLLLSLQCQKNHYTYFLSFRLIRYENHTNKYAPSFPVNLQIFPFISLWLFFLSPIDQYAILLKLRTPSSAWIIQALDIKNLKNMFGKTLIDEYIHFWPLFQIKSSDRGGIIYSTCIYYMYI